MTAASIGKDISNYADCFNQNAIVTDTLTIAHELGNFYSIDSNEFYELIYFVFRNLVKPRMKLIVIEELFLPLHALLKAHKSFEITPSLGLNNKNTSRKISHSTHKKVLSELVNDFQQLPLYSEIPPRKLAIFINMTYGLSTQKYLKKILKETFPENKILFVTQITQADLVISDYLFYNITHDTSVYLLESFTDVGIKNLLLFVSEKIITILLK